MAIKKGIALILTIGILSLLSMVGVIFAINGLLELKQTDNYKDTVKAKYIAEAGLARAIAELKYGSSGAVSTPITSTANLNYVDTTLGYNVSVVDCASRICIGDNNPNLAQILKNLNVILGSPLTTADCDNIATNRPYLKKEMVKTIIGKDKYDLISNYITVYSYVDPYVVNPTDLTTPFAFQPRAPINVNTASKEVLEAVLMGIRTDYSCPHCGGDGLISATNVDYACPACDGAGNLEITQTEAALLADEIIARRPFSTLNQLYGILKTFCNSSSYTNNTEDADLVMANANPNTGFSWCRNAGWASRLGYLGKYRIPWTGSYTPYQSTKTITFTTAGLSRYTTEFSFSSGGYYEISSIGTTAKGSVKNLIATVKTFDIYRQTTQSQFEAGTRTNLVSYPENIAAGVSACGIDGQIMLSRISYSSPSTGVNHFRANYLNSLNADTCGGTNGLVTPPLAKATKPNVGSLMNFSNRGDLAPDGIQADDFNSDCAAYLPLGNVSETEGTIEIWFRPRYNSYDTITYGARNWNKFMLRLMSGTPIPTYAANTGEPFTICFFWSCYGELWFGGIRGGGQYMPADATHSAPWWDWVGPKNFAGGFFYGPQSYFDIWSPGEWRQFVFSWKGPTDSNGNYAPLDTTAYANSPVCIYMNGLKRCQLNDRGWCYHTPYINTDADRLMQLGNEADKYIGQPWNTPGIPMLSDAVIGSVKVWPRALTDNEVQTEYQAGCYNGTGSFTSSTVMKSSPVEWGTISWTEAIPSGIAGSIVFNVDTGSGSWTGNYTNSQAANPINVKSSSIRYKADFAAGPGAGAQTEQDMNVTPGGGFEGGDPATQPSIPINPPWFGKIMTSPSTPMEATTDRPHTGSRSAKMVAVSSVYASNGNLITSFYVEPGKNYKVDLWTYISSGTDNTGNIWANLTFIGGGSSSGVWGTGNFPKTYDQWIQKTSGWITAPSWAAYGSIRVNSTYKDGRNIYFDDFSATRQGGIVTDPLMDTPVLEDVTITYLPKTKILEQQWQ